jgi:flagellar secretion chaperone FliS
MNQPYQVYQQTRVTTSNPMKLVLMLYDGAITFLKKSIENVEKKETKNKIAAINRAKEIIAELNSSLNCEIGGEFALRLRDLYFFMDRHLFQASVKDDVQAIRDVIQLLSSLREAWQNAYDQVTAPDNLSRHPNQNPPLRQSGIRI